MAGWQPAPRQLLICRSLIPTSNVGNSPMNKMFRNTTLALLLLISVGCSDGRIGASGTVSLDGKPLESGAISFRPAPENTSNSSGGQIVQGQFQLAAKHGLGPGKFFVTVQSFKATGRMVLDKQSGKMIAEQARIKFKETGKLEAVLAAGADNRFDFQLTSDGFDR